MLDSERTLKLKLRLHWTVLETIQYLQNNNCHKFDQGH